MSGLLLAAALAGFLAACTGGGGPEGASGQADSGPPDTGALRPDVGHPFVAVRPEHRSQILARIDAEPWATIYQRVVDEADEELRESDTWDHSVEADNAMTAEANAFLAWLHDDAERAERAKAALDAFRTDFDTNTEWDVNIRMPRPLMCATSAWDLLLGGGFLTAEEEQRYADAITSVTGRFFDDYIEDDAVRLQLLGLSQNNHPLRTVAAVGVPALAFPEHPDAGAWLDFAASETAWLLGPDGLYIQPDGKVSEGPFYFGFGMSASVGFLVAAEHARLSEWPLTWDCRNRNDVDPWVATNDACVDGAPLVFDSPLRDPWFQRAFTWSLTTRLPGGLRAPIADGNLVQQNGGQLVAAFADPALAEDAAAWVWDWLESDTHPADTTRAYQLSIQTLALLTPDAVEAAAPPSWTARAFDEGGGEVSLRSGWGRDDLWLHFLAEEGAARKTLHDHVDGLSFSLAAYGEYLLIDTGYYKPSALDNARTADGGSHNVVLLDGQGAPDKGLLTTWGDADATLGETFLDGASPFAVARGTQDIGDALLSRRLVRVRDRYVLVADQALPHSDGGVREWSWRVHGHAGYDAGGSFVLGAQGARFERDAAGIDVVVAASADGLTAREPPLVEGEPPHVHQFDLDRSVGEHAVVDAVVDAPSTAFLAALLPYATAAAADAPDGPMDTEVLALACAGWAGQRVRAADGGIDDLAVVREAAADPACTLPDGRVVETDAAVVVLGADGHYLALDGGSLVVEDVVLCDAPSATCTGLAAGPSPPPAVPSPPAAPEPG